MQNAPWFETIQVLRGIAHGIAHALFKPLVCEPRRIPLTQKAENGCEKRAFHPHPRTTHIRETHLRNYKAPLAGTHPRAAGPALLVPRKAICRLV